ncbi:MAG TPA: hypothetical protein VMV16_03625 [Solirubrobacteraceae bacterium]|nr:hypothetical protein [Solirubrobacteraceae bacterium]
MVRWQGSHDRVTAALDAFRDEHPDAEGHGRLAARRTLGRDASDVRTRLGRVIAREPA